MKNGKVCTAFIGVGNFITGHHLPNVAANDRIHIRALCDLDEEKLRDRQARFGGDYVTTRIDDVLADDSVDFVIIGTRPDNHAELSIKAARAGKDVFCEKPMSHTLEGMEAVVHMMNETGRRYMVGHNRRFAPAMLAAKALVGKQPKPVMMLYRMVDNAELWPAWPMLVENGGKILNECSHIFDLLAWMCDAEPVRLYCIGRLEDNNVVSIDYDDGSIASMVSGGLGSEAYPKELLEVFCGAATVSVDHFLQVKVNGISGVRDQSFPYKEDRWGESVTETGSEGLRRRMEIWRKHIDPEDLAGKYYYNLPTVDKGHYTEMDTFAACIREDRPLPTNAVDAARATACCFKAIESMQGKTPVSISRKDYAFAQ